MTNRRMLKTIEDKNGTKFTFTLHEYNPDLGLYINKINYNPNNKSSIKTSINVLLNQARFWGSLTKLDTVPFSEQGLLSIPIRLYDEYKFSFFKSKYYHSAISLFYQNQYLLVVENEVPFNRNALAKVGVSAVSESEYQAALEKLSLPDADYQGIRKELGIANQSNKRLEDHFIVQLNDNKDGL